MPSLKDLKNRIESVKSTRKITSAMKMVAASKLKRAQEQAEAARPYAEQMAELLASLAGGLQIDAMTPRLIAGTGADKTHLLIAVTSDRGLCGAFNGSVVRETKRQIRRLRAEGNTVKLFCIGRKGRDLLKRDHADLILESIDDIGRKKLSFADADHITRRLLDLFAQGKFDIATVIYNKFKSAMTQIVTPQQIIPTPLPEKPKIAANDETAKAVYEFEPDETTILSSLLPRNLAVQIYKTLLESSASEQGARMTAMDSATRNAGDMISKLTLNYNRARQAYITKEMIEIVSGAEAAVSG